MWLTNHYGLITSVLRSACGAKLWRSKVWQKDGRTDRRRAKWSLRCSLLPLPPPPPPKKGRSIGRLFVPRLSRKRGTLNLIRPSVPPSVRPSVRPSLRPPVPLSVTKTLTWLISSEVLMIEHWYLACMILVTGPFNWHHVVTLTLTFDLLQGQICCRAGDLNSPNLLVVFKVQFCTRIYIFVKRSQDL